MPGPSPQREEGERERSNSRLCSKRTSSAHIGNSTVLGSRCDLPVAHLLASAKCKSPWASVSSQYSQEHEGSCAEGRVRAGRQQGALSPPLSGVYGLKKNKKKNQQTPPCLSQRLCRERGLTATALSPASGSISGGWRGGRYPACARSSAEAAAPTLRLHRTWRCWGGGPGPGRRVPRVSLARGQLPPSGTHRGVGSHPAPFLWCDGSSPNPRRNGK